MSNYQASERAINDVYKNAHIALQSIADILPAVEDEDFRTELKSQYEGYEQMLGEIASFMAEKNIKPKDIGPMKKAMLWSAIKMKTMMNNSRNQIAEMMLKGTEMGINELTAMKNEKENYDEEVTCYIQKLLRLEEDYEERLRKFL